MHYNGKYVGKCKVCYRYAFESHVDIQTDGTITHRAKDIHGDMCDGIIDTSAPYERFNQKLYYFIIQHKKNAKSELNYMDWYWINIKKNGKKFIMANINYGSDYKYVEISCDEDFFYTLTINGFEYSIEQFNEKEKLTIWIIRQGSE